MEKRTKLDSFKQTLVSEIGIKCPDLRIVKEYKSLETLELDNYKQIGVDEDKVIYGKGEGNIVQVGHYALLDLGGKNRQLWKRISPGDGQQMWALQHDAAVDSIVQSNRDFCIIWYINWNDLCCF